MSEVNADGNVIPVHNEIVNLIREDSRNGIISSEKRILACTSDCGELSGLTGKLSENTDFADIKEIRSSKALYFCSTNFMSDSYAELAVMLEEKDLLRMVVSTIRNDCKVYPRPTSIEIFKDSPYHISDDEIQDLLKILESDKQYSDISFCRTSVDSIYLYSTEYMQKAQAEYLSEWDAVEQYECQ